MEIILVVMVGLLSIGLICVIMLCLIYKVLIRQSNILGELKTKLANVNSVQVSGGSPLYADELYPGLSSSAKTSITDIYVKKIKRGEV